MRQGYDRRKQGDHRKAADIYELKRRKRKGTCFVLQDRCNK